MSYSGVHQIGIYVHTGVPHSTTYPSTCRSTCVCRGPNSTWWASVYTPVNILYVRDMRCFSESIECTVQNYTLFWSTGVRRDCKMYCQRVISGTTRTLCRFVHNYYKLYEKMHRLSLDVVVLEVSMLLAETIKMSALMSPLKWLRRSYFCSRRTFRASHIGIVLQDTRHL